MTRAARFVICLALGSSLFAHARPSAADGGPAAQESHAPAFARYGQVTLRELPAATPPGAATRALPFRPPNPSAFRRHKASSTDLLLSPPAASAGGAASISITDSGFDGVSFGDAGAIPPDTQIAAGPDHLFEAVNSRVRIWSRQGSVPSVVYDVDLGTFFGVGFFTLTDVISDPRVLYDQASGRWFVSCVTLETIFNHADWRIAVSKTSDPTGAYTLYAATFTGTFPDFPSLGLSDDKLVVTGNAYTIGAQQLVGSEFLVARKADVVAGSSSASTTFFGPPQAVDSIQAAQSLSSTSTLFLAAVGGDGDTSTFHLWAIDGVPGVGNGVTVTTRALQMQTTVVVPPNAPQPNSSIAIATNDARLLNLTYRDGSLWTGGTTGCTPAGDTAARACLHFVRVDTATQTIGDEILFGEPNTYYFYPAVTIDASNNMLAVFNRSSASEFASVYASGHAASDAAGSFESPTLVHSGLAAYDPSPYEPRWGDYSGIAVDPFDLNASVWVAGEYERADGGFDWGTWIAKISAPAGCSLPAAPTGLGASAGDARVTLAWTASAGAASYNVRRATVSGGPYTTVGTTSTATYTDTAVTNGVTYYYVVSAVNPCGESSDSGAVSATPAAVAVAPAPPTQLSASGAKRKVMLTWTQSVSAGVTQNQIYRSATSGGPYSVIAIIGANTSYTDTQVVGRTTYYYVVTAVSSSGESAASNQASAKTK